MNQRTGLPYELPPEGSISTEEASRLLGISMSCTRSALHRRKISFCFVKPAAGQLNVYWRRSEVMAYLEGLPPLCESMPPGMIETREALKLLGIGRSSLYRYVHSRKLHQYRFRLNTRRGMRVKLLYRLAEVKRLNAHMRAVRACQCEMTERHRKYMELKNEEQR